MANKLIGEDLSLHITLGGGYDGSVNPLAAPTAGTTNIIGVARRLGLKESLDKTNVKAMGDYTKKNRYHSAEQSCEIETFVPSTGYTIPPNAVGCYITVTHSPLSSLAAPFSFIGVVTEWDYDAATATEQTVKITIDGNPDYLATGP